MQLFVEDIAMEVLKTMLTSDQREVIQIAKEEGDNPADLFVQVSFDYAELFLNEYTQRFRSGKKRKSR